MALISLPTDFSDGTIPTAAQFDGNFNVIANEFNGNIDNANIKAGAAIVESKILFSTSGHGHTGGTDGKSIPKNRAIGFFKGIMSVANDLSWNPTVPQAMTANKLWIHAKTAPTGAALLARVYNITQALQVATITLPIGATDASLETMVNAALAAGDVLRMDVTQVGSTVAGENISLILECTQ